jgi:hypothetical protein
MNETPTTKGTTMKATKTAELKKLEQQLKSGDYSVAKDILKLRGQMGDGQAGYLYYSKTIGRKVTIPE